MSRYALVVGNTEYSDPGLAKLTAPGKDAEALARVLRDKDICAFDDVTVLLNEPEPVVRDAIDGLFDQKKPDDLLVLYFSGHGVRDEYGSLFLAVKNTNRLRLRATAVKSDFIRESMDQSRSRRQVLILDCCNSGAFAQGTKAATGVSIGTASAFEGTGYGRVVLTASDATQFAWEGEKVIGDTQNSLFTHFLVKGLEGEADNDGDGRITIDELYDYAYEQIVDITPKQTPGKWSYKQQGEIVLRQSMPSEAIKVVKLPDDLIDEIQDARPYVREAAVQKLTKILQSRNIGLRHSAKEALEGIAEDENTTRRVAELARQALEAYHRAEEARQTAAVAAEQDGNRKQAVNEAAAAKLRAREVTQQLAAQQAEQARKVQQRKEAEGRNDKARRSMPRPWGRIGIIGIASVSVLVLAVYLGRSLLQGGAPATATQEPPQTTVPPTAVGSAGNVAAEDPYASLEAACKQEGMLTLMATPRTWANYGDIFNIFQSKTGISINSINENGSSAEELTAIEANKATQSPQAPDIVDVGYAYGKTGKDAGDFQPYKVSNWDKIPGTLLGIPAKDPDGYWTGGYYGVMAIVTNDAVVPNPPAGWSDLLKPEYKGEVALSGDPHGSNQAILAVYAAALANGGSLDNAQPGLDFFKQLNDAGNLLPAVAKSDTLANGTTPIALTWDYLALGYRDSFAGNPALTITYPSPTIASMYVQAISAYAPHPNCAKLWMEILHSDEGQLAWMKGYTHGVNQADMEARGAVPAELKAKIPPSSDFASAMAPTTDQITAAKAIIAGNWDTSVGVNIK